MCMPKPTVLCSHASLRMNNCASDSGFVRVRSTLAVTNTEEFQSVMTSAVVSHSEVDEKQGGLSTALVFG